jgi:aryl-alcohol dehydrogenase-like predicted oxidoreductase
LSSCTQLAKKPTLPISRRTLGKTGLPVTLLTFGGGSQFLKNEDGAWEPLLERAVEVGINLFDTSSEYQWGASMTSEERFGRILPRYRDRVLISTKFSSRDADGAQREFEQSLQRLKVDVVDILMIHSIEPTDDVAALERGAYRTLVKLKEEGAARHIGFSCMNSAEKAKEFLEKLDFDVVLLAMNPTKYGDFADRALPAARARNVGTLAMKVVRDLVGKEATARELLTYAWTQKGVSSALVGHHGMQVFEENVAAAKLFTGAEALALDRRRLENRLAHLAGPHRLSWARPDYRDNGAC